MRATSKSQITNELCQFCSYYLYCLVRSFIVRFNNIYIMNAQKLKRFQNSEQNTENTMVTANNHRTMDKI